MPNLLQQLITKILTPVAAGQYGLVPTPQGAAQAVGAVIQSTTANSAALTRDNRAMAVEYARNIYIWRCVDLISAVAASVPLWIRVPEQDEDVKLTTEQQLVLELMHHPNSQWSGEAMMYFLVASLAVTNRAYVLMIRGVGNRPIELWPIPSNSVSNVFATDGSGRVTGYRVTINGREQVYLVNADGQSDIIFINRPVLNAATDKSPAAVAAPPGEVFNRILQRSADITSGSPNITGILSTEEDLGSKAVQEIKDRIDSYRTGKIDSGGIIVAANAKWAMTRLTDDPSQLLSVDVKNSLARDIAMTMGVPPQLVGLPDSMTYDSYMTARAAFITESVIPGYTSFICSALSRALLPKDDSAYIEEDLDAIPAIQRERLTLVDTASSAKMLSLNEQRSLIGYAPVDDPYADVPVQMVDWEIARLKTVTAPSNPVDDAIDDGG